MVFETLRWVDGIDGYLELINQRRLPAHFEMLKCENTEQLYEAIKTLAVRGAPAIGVAGGFGICLAMRETGEADLSEALSRVKKSADYLENPQVAQRIKQCLPDVKLVFVLRKPIERAFSNYLWSCKNGIETLPFGEALER